MAEPLDPLLNPEPAGEITGEPVRRGRAASVTLSPDAQGRGAAGDADGGIASLDPAARSLADALRITYRLLQASMFILIGLFLLSGFQSVNLGERAIRTVFGRVVDSDLGPGFRFSYPAPIGELVRVQTAAPQVRLDEAFWPGLSPEEKNRSVEELAGGGMGYLDPVKDGSLLTADGNIVHTKWSVKYRRDQPRLVEESIGPDFEQRIVLGAVKRGIVNAVSQVTLDELIRGQADPARRDGIFPSVEAVSLRVAQRTLDEMRSGIVIEQLALGERMAPRQVQTSLASLTTAASDAGKAIEAARTDRTSRLTEAAGDAAEEVLRRIDRYEEQLRLGDKDAAASTQTTIDRLLAGEPVEIDGKTVRPNTYGRARTVLDQARQYRFDVASRAQSDLRQLEGVGEAFRSNPQVVLNRLWTDSLQTFMNRDTVQAMLLPPGLDRVVITVNRDPAIARDQETTRRIRENKAAQQRARDAREKATFSQPAGSTKPAGGG